MPIDYSKYPPNWKTEIRPRILERADNMCEICFVKNHRFIKRLKFLKKEYYIMGNEVYHYPNGKYAGRVADVPSCMKENLKEIKIVLTIAHLDHDEENWNVKDDRLMAMCQKCHLKYDVKEKINRRKVKKLTK